MAEATTTTEPAATTTANPAAAAITNEPPAWYGEQIKDPDTAEWLKAKGYKDLAATVHSHRELEKTIGAERLILPEKDGDITKWSGWDKVGAKKDAKAYAEAIKRPTMPDGVQYDEAFEGKALEIATKLRAPVHVVQGMIDLVTAERLAQFTAAEAAQKEDRAAFDREIASWGTQKDEFMELARRGAKEFGIEGEALAELGGLVGSAKLMRAMKEIGKVLKEGRMVEGDGRNILTPEQARAEIKEFRRVNAGALSNVRDPNHADLQKQLTVLYRQAHPTERVQA